MSGSDLHCVESSAVSSMIWVLIGVVKTQLLAVNTAYPETFAVNVSLSPSSVSPSLSREVLLLLGPKLCQLSFVGWQLCYHEVTKRENGMAFSTQMSSCLWSIRIIYFPPLHQCLFTRNPLKSSFVLFILPQTLWFLFRRAVQALPWLLCLRNSWNPSV